MIRPRIKTYEPNPGAICRAKSCLSARGGSQWLRSQGGLGRTPLCDLHMAYCILQTIMMEFNNGGVDKDRSM